jgi:hypothetical protein
MPRHLANSHKKSLQIWILALVLLVAFGLRLHRLAYDSVWWDEGYSIWMARMPVREMLFQTANDAHPPLSYAMLHGWRALVGDEELALRALSVFFGLLTVAVSYQIGREVGGWKVGLAGALLTAVARLPVWWSQEVRMYAPATLFAARALWAAVRLVMEKRRIWLWAAVLAASLGAGLLNLYLFGGVAIALNLAFVYAFVAAGERHPPPPLRGISPRETEGGKGALRVHGWGGIERLYAFFASRRRWRLTGVWAAAQVGALALFLPWWLWATRYLPSWETPQSPVDLWFVVKLYLSTVFLGIATDIERYTPVLVGAIVVLVGAGAVVIIRPKGGEPGGEANQRFGYLAPTKQHSKKQYAAWVLLVVGVLLPPVLVFLLSLPRGQFNYPTPSPRYFLLLSTPVYVLVGWGAVTLIQYWRRAGQVIGAAVLAAFGGLSAWSLNQYYAGLRLADDYISIAATLEAFRQPGDTVILNNDTDWPIFAYHYSGDFERHITKTQRIWDEKYAADLVDDYRGQGAVWLVQTRYAEVTDPDNYLGQWLRQRSWNWRTYVFPEAQVWFYAMNPERGDPKVVDMVGAWPTIMAPVDAPIADGVRLVGYTHPIPEVDAGSLMIVGLGWEKQAGLYENWTVGVQVLGADGEEITSTLVELNATSIFEEERFVNVELFIPPETPSGKAQVIFIANETWLPLYTFTIRGRDAEPVEAAALPASAVPIDMQYGPGIKLLGVDLPDQVVWEPGDGIPLTLYWQALQPIPERYKVFVHLVGTEYNPDTNNLVWGQQDQEPRNGAEPTTSWRTGALIADDYLVPVWEDAPPGAYQLQVGVYLPINGQRLPVFDADGQPLGDSVTVYEVTIE